jgi:outer membrane protein OmpA-like peptidoglycan-associated protein
MKVLQALLLLFPFMQLSAQLDEIPLLNPSFEGTPARGSYESSFQLGGWFDCAPYFFYGQTPPDVQPGTMDFFDVTTKPEEGNTYLGMVTRQNETWELVSQRLRSPLENSNCYSFEISLARSETYISQLLDEKSGKEFNFNKPIVLRIWGGRNVYEKRELLAESPVIDHTEWRRYRFEFEVKQDHDFLILEAFYKTPTLLPYNGNVLLDNASPVIQQIPCPGGDEFTVQVNPEKANSTLKKPEQKKIKPERVKKDTDMGNPAQQKEPPVFNKVESKPHDGKKILTELDKATLREGQTIRIEQLYFKADSSNFTSSSYAVLNEIFHFLNQNPGVVIEIGGHTNGIPGTKYCQDLSLKRAMAVANYLYEKGIPEERIAYKGYGKQRPIASNKTHLGRQKNQRVEIKILKIN